MTYGWSERPSATASLASSPKRVSIAVMCETITSAILPISGHGTERALQEAEMSFKVFFVASQMPSSGFSGFVVERSNVEDSWPPFQFIFNGVSNVL